VSTASERVETEHPLVGGCAPRWSSGWGQDVHGPFVQLTIGDVTQVLRWIPPGRFYIGSPSDEPGRFPDREAPVHQIDVSRGFWLFDTPCPQKLWEAVMGDNPSRFKSPERPVERVSWYDCQQFIDRCNSLVYGLTLRLPTEAEWEYACRAGTTDATYAGPIEILGRNHAPVLDQIAWYGGNCGVHFDLQESDDAEWPEKQYDFTRGGTRTVAIKRPNPWGLYDMLGNVLEWCRDGQRAYHDQPEVDPVGPEEPSADRVVRGGSWRCEARHVRAAYRTWHRPTERHSTLGFRCRVQ
jgi:formylglycine-generating enzyme required for sulfatase activity